MSAVPLPFPRRVLGLGIILALGYAVLATWAMREKSTTADELAHVTAGYAFNRLHDYRLQPENGILPQRWQALPAAVAGADFPSLSSPAWRTSTVWMLGYDFFYLRGNDPDQLLLGARAMNALFGAATVLLVFCWSYRLWGTAGAAVSGIFCALCPTMLAHGALATSDMSMAFFFLAASGAYWRHLHDGRKRVWLLSAVLLGLAAVAKYSAVLLLPFAAVLAVARVLETAPLVLAGRTFRTPLTRAGAIAVSTLAQGVVAAIIIWAFFGFCYHAINPALPAGEFNMPWEVVLAPGSFQAACINGARHWQLLPEGWLYGLSFVLHFTQGRAAFLDGDYSIYGWVDFFPRAFLYKTPPSLLLAATAAALLAALHLRTLPWRQILGHLRRGLPLLVLFVGYWLASLGTHLNIGQRHLLPTYPVLYILTGALGWAAIRAWRQSRTGGLAGAVAAGCLLAWHVGSAGAIHPHYLAYFSPLVGGAREGYRHLVDSSLDWGQDLPALRHWLATHRQPGEPVYVSYFGADEPRRFIPDAIMLPRLPSFERPRAFYEFEPGVYAISATQLQHVYRSREAAWSEALEQRYQPLRDRYGKGDAAEQLPGPSPDEDWLAYERLCFARLCIYLRAREPDDFAGYSILIYRLSPEDLELVLDTNLPAFTAAVETLRNSER